MALSEKTPHHHYPQQTKEAVITTSYHHLFHFQLLPNRHKRQLDPAPGNQTTQLIDPTPGDPFISVAQGSSQDVNTAIEAAYKAFSTGPWTTKTTGSQRRDYLFRIASNRGKPRNTGLN